MNGTAMLEDITHEQCADIQAIGRNECKDKAGEETDGVTQKWKQSSKQKTWRKKILVKNASTFYLNNQGQFLWRIFHGWQI